MTLLILIALISLIVGAAGVYAYHRSQAAAWTQEREAWEGERASAREERARIEVERASFVQERAMAATRLHDAESEIARQREDFQKTVANLQVTFKGISSEVLRESREEFLKQAEPRIGEHVRPLREALSRYEEAIREIERKREHAYGSLNSVLDILKQGQHVLTRETATLVSALKSSSSTRGRWGEVTLARVVEVAGMSAYCDFETQSSVNAEEGRLRPDLVVRMPRGRSVVVDAKVPLTAYMQALEAVDEQHRATHLAAHAQAVREHMRALGAKNYWTQFSPAPDFVVLFLPGESFFSAALEKDRQLIEDGMQSRVVLATPTTLIALLRVVAMGWQQEQLAENAARISEAGKDLFERCGKFAEHFGNVGGNLERAIKAFNSAVGSWETRVVPGARKLKELGATRSPDAEIPAIEGVQSIPRVLTPSEESTISEC